MRSARAGILIAAIYTAAGCYSQGYSGDGGRSECEPVEGPLSTSVRADDLTGEYRLVVIATEGERAGTAVSGALRLRRMPEGMRLLLDPSAGGVPREGVSVPLFGTADLDVEAVGGAIAGGLSSEDPQRPGALVVEERAAESEAPRIFVRLGSEANDRSRQRFDGDYFALVVKAVDAEALRGSWASGHEAMQAGGHFCAYR